MEVRKFSTPPSDGEAVAWELQCLPSSDSGESLSRVAIGTFDGVHVGHQSVIRGCGTVVTFDQPPVNVLSTKNPKKLISDLPRDCAGWSGWGFDGWYSSSSTGHGRR